MLVWRTPVHLANCKCQVGFALRLVCRRGRWHARQPGRHPAECTMRTGSLWTARHARVRSYLCRYDIMICNGTPQTDSFVRQCWRWRAERQNNTQLHSPSVKSSHIISLADARLGSVCPNRPVKRRGPRTERLCKASKAQRFTQLHSLCARDRTRNSQEEEGGGGEKYRKQKDTMRCVDPRQVSTSLHRVCAGDLQFWLASK